MMPFPSYYGFGRVDEYLPGMGMVESDGGDSSLTGLSAEAKAIAANKNHSEAERRRRERINGHLATLRTLIPKAAKADKASLLAEVVQKVRELRQNAADIVSFNTAGEKTDGISSESGVIEGEKGKNSNRVSLPLLPDETDVVTAEPEPGSSLILATVSCEDRPELLSDLDAALKSLKLNTVKAEIATLGGRTKGVFSMEAEEADCATIRHALRAVVEKGCIFPGNKRPRLARPSGGPSLV
ncbi:transcription factor bHLH30-like [Aristolochia californica]|uniref:transcription factor bHLH30-like n=1 Tax=Aristolochia californica TaxID=171875 RepID=UPI0035E35F69